MKIFTTEGIRRIGNRTLDRENISMLDMMERAAESVSFELMSRWRPSQRFVIFAGPGDNGGDALAVAAYQNPENLPDDTGYITENQGLNI